LHLITLNDTNTHTHTHTNTRWDFSWGGIGTLQRNLSDNTQLSQETHIHALGGIQNRNPSKGVTEDQHLRPRDHRDQLNLIIGAPRTCLSETYSTSSKMNETIRLQKLRERNFSSQTPVLTWLDNTVYVVSLSKVLNIHFTQATTAYKIVYRPKKLDILWGGPTTDKLLSRKFL